MHALLVFFKSKWKGKSNKILRVSCWHDSLHVKTFPYITPTEPANEETNMDTRLPSICTLCSHLSNCSSSVLYLKRIQPSSPLGHYGPALLPCMDACLALPGQTTLGLSWLRKKRKGRKEEDLSLSLSIYLSICLSICKIYCSFGTTPPKRASKCNWNIWVKFAPSG